MIPEGWEKKSVDEMTLKEALMVEIGHQICGSCDDCFSHQHNWKNATSCSKAYLKAQKVLEQEYETYKVDEIAVKLLERLEQKQNEPEELAAPSKMIAYKDTINLMKSHGYHRCYMCGASLERNE